MSAPRLTPVEEARATIWALMTEEGLSLDDIAFIHGWDSADGLRSLMSADDD